MQIIRKDQFVSAQDDLDEVENVLLTEGRGGVKLEFADEFALSLEGEASEEAGRKEAVLLQFPSSENKCQVK